MIPVLYSDSEEYFVNNGIGLLVDAISCKVVEERNGKFELEMQYPQNGLYYNDLAEGCFIKAKPNDRDPEQPFRIYKTGKPVAGICTYYAEHISYEYNADPVPNFEATGKTANEALNQLLEDAIIQKPYTAWSDITDRRNIKLQGVYNVRNILGGVEGSIIDTFGGELQFDRYTIKLHENRGSDNGVVIRYGKNLIDAQQEKNIANVATSIFPYCFYSEGSQQDEPTLISLPEKTISTPHASLYTRNYCIPVDFSDKFEEDIVPTEELLRELARDYVKKGIDIPSISIKLSFIDLSKTKDYANLQAVEQVGLCDTVTVILERLGISEKAKVIKTDYDVLKERYNQVELGEAKANLYTELNVKEREAFQKIIKTATRSEVLKKQFERKIVQVTAAITGNSGGYVVLSPAENPQEIFIMDTDSMSTAQNVWRWNLAGLGHSSTGVNGPFTTAITAAGEIVANFITAGELDGQIIKAGSIQAESIDLEYRQSITRYTDDGDAALLADYTTKFQVVDGKIASKVSIGNVSSEISQEAGNITISSDRLKITSTYFKLDRDGKVEMTEAKVNGKVTSTDGTESMVLDESMLRGYHGAVSNSNLVGYIDLAADYGSGSNVTYEAVLGSKRNLYFEKGNSGTFHFVNISGSRKDTIGEIKNDGWYGDVHGDVTGDLTGNVYGDVTGNVYGDVSGDVTGNVTGNVSGNLTGNVTGNVSGNLTGNVTGDITGNVHVKNGVNYNNILLPVQLGANGEVVSAIQVNIKDGVIL